LEEADFNDQALEIFQFQYRNNSLYRDFTNGLQIRPDAVRSISQIPFLPISFFKTHAVKTTDFEAQILFESSGTTQTEQSRHLLRDLNLYIESFMRGFELFYGPASNFCVLGLLPSYLERKGSSLIFMVEELINRSGHARSGFYLNEYERLNEVLTELEAKGQPTLLIGVTYALLDFAEKFPMEFNHTIVMETGGMKGRRKELTREEVHGRLCKSFGLSYIHSEYGMTELHCGPWMRILVREDDDPMEVKEAGDGIIQVIDLANIYSCSFIATEDLGRSGLEEGHSFEVAGRLDASDLRGCNLLVT
jgi:hypothetical protein